MCDVSLMRGPPISSEKLPLAKAATRASPGAERTAAAIALPSARHRAADGSGGVSALTKTGTTGIDPSGTRKCSGTMTVWSKSNSWLMPTSKPARTVSTWRWRARSAAIGTWRRRSSG